MTSRMDKKPDSGRGRPQYSFSSPAESDDGASDDAVSLIGVQPSFCPVPIPPSFAFQYIQPDNKRITFQGLNETEFLEFVHAVLNKALELGNQRNDAWMADYAAACFVGGALKWYLRLPREVQYSWNLLLEALMEKYSDASRDIPPNPAAAAAPPAQEIKKESLFEAIYGTRRT